MSNFKLVSKFKPCGDQPRAIEELSKEYEGKAKICKVNIDDNAAIASRYSITSIPTMLVFRDGNVISQVIGFVSKAELAKRLDSAIG